MDMPVLVIHDPDDPVVPVFAAREHARFLPHAELVETVPVEFAAEIKRFFDRVENARR